MHNKLKDRRINGAALELIMQDVLKGMVEFTHDTCVECDAANMEILAVEAAPGAAAPVSNIVAFKRPRGSD